MQFQFSRSLLVTVVLFSALGSLYGAEADVNQITSAGATDDPVTAMRRFRVASGLKVDLFAADIRSRDRGLSAMPEEMGNVLSKSDLRNLLEFLATLK